MTELDIALHLRDLKEPGTLNLHRGLLKKLYKMAYQDEEGGTREPPSFNRIYVGDEFCSCRAPGLKELKEFGRFAAEKELPLTLLTPVLTDEGLERIAPLFDYLDSNHSGAEVVANDWGVLFFLKNRHPSLHLSAGRMLNKGYKDPRLKRPKESAISEEEPDPLLNAGTFDHEPVREKMAELGVARCERDLLPFQTITASKTFHFKSSCYFPFGYVTSGRVCWAAAFNQPPEKRYIPPRRCGRPCNGSTLELKNETFSFRLFQNGNTIFYHYPSPMLKSLFQHADQVGQRLVYQSFPG